MAIKVAKKRAAKTTRATDGPYVQLVPGRGAFLVQTLLEDDEYPDELLEPLPLEPPLEPPLLLPPPWPPPLGAIICFEWLARQGLMGR